MKKLLLTIALFFLLYASHAQLGSTPCKPALPTSAYTNSVSFDFTLKRFRFHFYGTDTVTYEYKPTTSGMLSALTCVLGSYTFNPSISGGLGLDTGGTEVLPWASGVSYSLKSVTASGDTLTARWRMSAGTDSVLYSYRFYISGRTLVMGVTPETANVTQFTFDRSGNSTNPVVVRVPYLSLFNVLLTGNRFTSLYMDWEKSTASEIAPTGRVFSSTSAYFSQRALYKKKTSGRRNLVRETAYLTVSPKLEEVFPSIPNPVSPQKAVSADHLSLDLWGGSFSNALTNMKKCHDAGVNKLWVVKHSWQNAGYDVKFPDIMPANPSLGGDTALRRMSDSAAAYNYLFGVHENYSDMYPDAPSWNAACVARESDGTLRKAWFNTSTGVQAYLIKPSLADSIMNSKSPAIHSTYGTTSTFVDVLLGTNPSSKVDYDSSELLAGTYRQTLQYYRNLMPTLRSHHNGPVSVEGTNHFMNAGYMDDVEAQINSGDVSGYWQGVRMPLLVNFQLKHVHPLMCGHGVGYYERFFSNDQGTSQYNAMPLDSTLTYMATELAYGNAGFIPDVNRVADLVKVARLEYKHVYAAQLHYANANVVSVSYNDNGTEVDASTYIRNHPNEFSDRFDSSFMGQVKVVYDNGTIVCVNRNRYKKWDVTLGSAGGWYNYHALINNQDSLNTGTSDSTHYVLPARNGWVVYVPQESAAKKDAQQVPVAKQAVTPVDVNVYPVPSTGLVWVEVPGTGAITIIANNMVGQTVWNQRYLQRGKQAVRFSQPGVYVVRVVDSLGRMLYNGQVMIKGR